MATLDELIAILSAIMAGLPQGVIVVDDQSRIRFFNRSAAEIYGYSLTDFGNLTLDQLLPIDLRQHHHHQVSSYIHKQPNRRAMGGRHRINGVRQDGQEFIADATISPFEVPDLPPMAMVIVTDQSARALDRRNIDQYLDSTAASSETLVALNALDDYIVVLDRDWHYVFVNQSALERVGKTKADLLGNNYWEVNPSFVGTRLEAAFREAMATGRKQELEFLSDVTNKWYRVRLIPSNLTLVVHSVDITSLKHVVESNQLLTETLERALDMSWDRKNYRSHNIHDH